MGDLARCGECPGRVDMGGDWARWGEGQRCVGRGSEKGCGSNEWTGVRVPKGIRPVGREDSLGQNSRWRPPCPPERAADHFPLYSRHCSEPGESPLRIALERVFRNSQDRRCRPRSPPALSLPTPTS